MIYDSDWTQKWINDKENTWSIIRMKKNIYVYINKFTITSYSNSLEYQPKSIELSVENNYNWTLINKYELDFSSNLRNTIFFDIDTLINAFKVNITEKQIPGEPLLYIRDIGFHSCNLHYCNSIDKIPKSVGGTVLTIPCHSNSSLFRNIYCPYDKGSNWIELDNKCNEEPYIIYKKESYIFIRGNNYKNVRLFSISGNNLTFNINKDIPGLNFDSLTGILSGIPYEYDKGTIYTFSIIDSFLNDIKIDVIIYVINPQNPVLINYNNSIVIEAGIEYNNLQLFNIIGEDINYEYYNFNFGMFYDENNGYIYGIATKEFYDNITVIASNDFGVIEISILIQVRLPLIPKIYSSINSYTFIYYEKYLNFQPILCVGKDLVYDVDPKLPYDLNFDNKNGIINGIIKDSPSQYISYRFTCKNNNGSDYSIIPMNISYSDYPIIISYESNITIIVGKIYTELSICNVIGNNLKYEINDNLPKELYFDENNGYINGYIKDIFEQKDYKITVSSFGKSVSFIFSLLSIIKPEPYIIPNSVINNITLTIGSNISNIYLFNVVGYNLNININPSLPNKLYIDNNTFEIYGIILDHTDSNYYHFNIFNEYGNVNIEVLFNYNEKYCENDNGFDRILATEIGNKILKECGYGKQGKIMRICYLINNEGIWGEIFNECEISSNLIIGINVGTFSFIFLIIIIIILIRIYIKRNKKNEIDMNLLNDKNII